MSEGARADSPTAAASGFMGAAAKRSVENRVANLETLVRSVLDQQNQMQQTLATVLEELRASQRHDR